MDRALVCRRDALRRRRQRTGTAGSVSKTARSRFSNGRASGDRFQFDIVHNSVLETTDEVKHCRGFKTLVRSYTARRDAN